MYRAKQKRTTIYARAVFDMETLQWIERVPFLTWFGPLESCEGADGGADPDPNTTDAGGNDPDNTGEESYFLDIGDGRTRYKTAEEAIHGYQEAGQRIAELTPWQAVAQEYGLTNPDDVTALLDELAELRAQANSGTRTQDGNRGDTAAAAAVTKLDPNSEEGKQAAAVEWLKVNGVKAGLIPESQLSQVNEAIERLTAEAEQVQEERFQQRMEYGHNVVVNELKTAGYFPTDPKDAKGIQAANDLAVMLEEAMTTWVNQDKRRIDAFHRGGESLANLVKQGMQVYLPRLNVLKSSSGAADAARRTANANAGPKRAVAGTVASTRPGTGAPASTKGLKPEDGITPAVHEAAWKVFEAARSRG